MSDLGSPLRAGGGERGDSALRRGVLGVAPSAGSGAGWNSPLCLVNGTAAATSATRPLNRLDEHGYPLLRRPGPVLSPERGGEQLGPGSLQGVGRLFDRPVTG